MTEPGGVILRRKNRSSSKSHVNDNSKSNNQNNANHKAGRRNDLWSSKRMSRSFDNNISFDDLTVCDEISDVRCDQDEVFDKSKSEATSTEKKIYTAKDVSESETLESCNEAVKTNDVQIQKQRDSFKAYLNVSL